MESRSELEECGFEIDPCDPRVANKMVDGKQLTACWHVDDLEISRIDPGAVDHFCGCLSGICGENYTTKRGGVALVLGDGPRLPEEGGC